MQTHAHMHTEQHQHTDPDTHKHTHAEMLVYKRTVYKSRKTALFAMHCHMFQKVRKLLYNLKEFMIKLIMPS